MQTALVKSVFHYICYLQNHTVMKQRTETRVKEFTCFVAQLEVLKGCSLMGEKKGQYFPVSPVVNTPGSKRLQCCLLWSFLEVQYTCQSSVFWLAWVLLVSSFLPRQKIKSSLLIFGSRKSWFAVLSSLYVSDSVLLWCKLSGSFSAHVLNILLFFIKDSFLWVHWMSVRDLRSTRVVSDLKDWLLETGGQFGTDPSWPWDFFVLNISIIVFFHLCKCTRKHKKKSDPKCMFEPTPYCQLLKPDFWCLCPLLDSDSW